ncbi:alpha/beta hydrolase-fold protein [Paenibacillus sp. PL2-23]|uniref:alpha/beta hydrolase n=1 Tax=Paenibacillus sp. PL2-23 TaxID=2100729 RepID=UPI0030F5CF47
MQENSTIVTIADFYASRLANYRSIYVYLPPGYKQEDRAVRYPVLYMHAGQRAFPSIRPGGDSWHVDEACDRLIAEGRIERIIVVAIGHVRPVEGNEFYHFKAPEEEADRIRCSGVDYEHFIVHELKPYIDRRFNTMTDAGHTALMGASAGALSSYHIGFRYPDVFGKLILLSPYFIKASLDAESPSGLREEKLYQDYPGRGPGRIWMDIGDAEGLFLPEHARAAAERLLGQGYRHREELAFLLQPDAAHEETAWAQRVEMPLLYMFGKPSRPAALELHGRMEVGIKGPRVRLNPLIRYENGLLMTVLRGDFHSERPDVLDIREDGTLVPRQEGEAWIHVQAEGLHASSRYTVVAELSELVSVTLTAEVPPAFSQADAIFGGMGMKLSAIGGSRYSGRFLVPRDSGYQFRFTQGFRRFELDADGNRVPNRRIRADQELDLHFTIERFAVNKSNETGRGMDGDGAISST